MKVVPRKDKLHFNGLLYFYIYAYMLHIYVLQLTEMLYFAKSVWTIFKFPSLNPILEKN